METYNRICIKDLVITDKQGNNFILKRGKEYLTSKVDKNNEVTVFSNFWVNVDVDYFVGEIQFTPA